MRLPRCDPLFLIVLIISSIAVMGVKQDDFKLCSQSSFCRRLRSIGTRQSEAPGGSWKSPYSPGRPISTPGVSKSDASWSWPVKSSLYPEIAFNLRIDILAKGDGIARIRMDEVDSKTPFKRYNETAYWSMVDPEPALAPASAVKFSKDSSTINYGAGLSIEVEHEPLRITQLRDGQPQIIFNERGLLHMEHFRIKDVEATAEITGEGEQIVLKGEEMDRSWFEESDADMFEESWKKWKDSKPKGQLAAPSHGLS